MFFILLIVLAGLNAGCSYKSLLIDNWYYTVTDSDGHIADIETRWQPYTIDTNIDAEDKIVWLRAEYKKSDNNMLLYVPFGSIYGKPTIYLDNHEVYTSKKAVDETQAEHIKSLIDINIPHVRGTGYKQYKYIYIKIVKIEDVPVKLRRAPVKISEKDFLRHLVHENIELIIAAVLLLFIAFISIPLAFLFREERKRFLILVCINIAGAVTLSTGNPYIWAILREPYSSITATMAIMNFLPVFIFWLVYESARKNRGLIKVFLVLHLVLAVGALAFYFLEDMPHLMINDILMGVFTFSQIMIVVTVFTDLFFGDFKDKFMGIGLVAMMLFTINDLLKSFGIFLITERPLFHWGLLSLSDVMLVYLMLEFESRQKNLLNSLNNLRELAFITSHKLRLPLANIIGITRLFEDNNLTEKEKASFTGNLLTSANQLDAVIKKMAELTDEQKAQLSNEKFIQEPVAEILLIDDDDINNMLNERIVSKNTSGIPIKVFSKAAEGVEYLRNKREKLSSILIFLDINMPQMNGFEFLDAIQEFGKEIRVFMLSSSVDMQDMQKAYSYHQVYGFISKPLSARAVAGIFSELNESNRGDSG